MKIYGLIHLERFIRKLFKRDKKTKTLINQIEKATELRTVILDISYYCNAECPFCPRQLLMPKLSGFMSKEIFYSTMKQIEKIPTVKTITLAAEGEPLMHPDFDEFVSYLKSKQFQVVFPTNMSLAHKHFDAMLKCDSIMFSVEGHNKETYEEMRKKLKFSTVFENIKTFHKLVEEKRKNGEHAPETSINFIVTKESKINEFIEMWEPYVDFIRIGPVGPVMDFDKKEKKIVPAFNHKMTEILLPLEENPIKFCCQPFNVTVIRPNGKLALCCSDYNIGLDLGNYKNLEKNFKKNKNLQRIRKEFLEHKLKVCENCPQHLMISRENYEKYLPELKNIEDRYKKVTVYALR